MKRLLLLSSLLFPLALSAQTIISSPNLQTNTQQQLSTTTPATLTTGTGYDFTSQPTITSIASISVTLTLQDGNSAMGEFDFNHLFLALDGINTGLALNGFRGNGLEDTLTISGPVSPAVAMSLLAQFADKRFVGTIVTNNPNDTILQPNDIFVGGGPSGAEMAMTTLRITAVPEPATVALLGAGLLVAGGAQLRRFRRNL